MDRGSSGYRGRGGSGGGSRGGGGRGRGDGGGGGGGPHQYQQQRRGPPSQGGGGGGGWDQHHQQRGDNTGEGWSNRSGGGGRGRNTGRGRGVGGDRDQTQTQTQTPTWTPTPTPAWSQTRTWTPAPTPTQTQWVGVGPTAPAPPLQPPAFSSPDPVPVPVPVPVDEFQSLKVSETPEDSDRIVPVKRPDKGGKLAIRTTKLRVNHFPVKFNPETVIMHYDIDVKPQVPSKNGRPVKISKSNLSIIRNKLSSDDPARFPLSMTAYDGEKNIFSAVSLPTGKFNVEVTEGEGMKAGSYVVTIKPVNQLKLRKLKDYLCGQLLSIPREILQGMDLVIKENPARHMIPVGRHFFPKEHREDDDLGWGITASRGFQHSLKSTSQGLAMCLDYSVLAFRKRMPVIDFLGERIGGFDLNKFQRFRGAVEKELLGLKVNVTHRKTKQKYTIGKLTKENTREISFPVEDPEGQIPPSQVGIVDYFQDKYNKDIMYKDIPCLDFGKGGRKNYVPMEFCILVEGQRYPKEHLDRDGEKKLKFMSLVPAKVREREICSMVRWGIGPFGGGIAQNFGMEVNTNMTTVMGRVIGPPELKLGAPNGRVIRVKVDRDRCQWNLVGNSVVEGKRIERWAVLDFSSSERSERSRLDPYRFIPRLRSRCENLGIYMEEPLIYKNTSMNKFSNADMLRELLKGIKEEAYNKFDRSSLQIILCVMSRKDPGYKSLKWISETEVGIVTQCCLATSTTANNPNDKFLDQYLANLAMKINAKLGGSNVELHDPLPHFFEGKGHVMFIGADVNHPGSWDSTCPSIAAVVATMNWPAANRYAARVCPQHHRKERIMNFGDMCLDLVESYARLNKVRPDNIVVFRDGVSESQFDMALNEELQDLKRAFHTISYKPTITLIVAQKRHQTRLFPENERDGGSTGNVSPGTVVDTNIVHPFEFDFYLCSHYGSLGTSKPTHYYVLWDEHGFTSDQLQKLIYDMCFTFARCTKPVSLVPPVYYADLAAYRGRMYCEAMQEGHSPISARPSSSASSSSSLSSVASFGGSFYKLHANLENVMFFV